MKKGACVFRSNGTGIRKKLVGGDTPTHNRQFLERRIAYRLQGLEFRKVDANLLNRNQRRIESLVETGKVKNATAITVLPLARYWSGNTKASSTASSRPPTVSMTSRGAWSRASR